MSRKFSPLNVQTKPIVQQLLASCNIETLKKNILYINRTSCFSFQCVDGCGITNRSGWIRIANILPISAQTFSPLGLSGCELI